MSLLLLFNGGTTAPPDEAGDVFSILHYGLLGGFSVAGAGVTADFARTMEPFRLSSASSVAVSTTFDRAAAAASLAASASVAVQATLARTTDNAGLSAATQVAVASEFARTLATFQLSASASPTLTATLSRTTDGARLSATTAVAVAASFDRTTGAFALDASATAGVAVITATLARTTDDFLLSASATVPVSASAAIELAPFRLTASATVGAVEPPPDEGFQQTRFGGHGLDLSQAALREYQKRYERDIRDMGTMAQAIACLIAEIDE